jgi:hypothetical protein
MDWREVPQETLGDAALFPSQPQGRNQLLVQRVARRKSLKRFLKGPVVPVQPDRISERVAR